ncbi:MAG TPA: hypothetical protein VMV40_01255 [Acidiferrobacter sp.]|nr:hypothetical protein [Acidiferrobacter sp.]
MYTPTNKDEFLDLLDQAIFETRDMLSVIESEGEECELGDHVEIFLALEQMLAALHADVQNGRHAFDGKALSYAALLARFRSRIPFADILDTLSLVQKGGF